MPVVTQQVAVLQQAEIAIAAAHADRQRAVVQAGDVGRKLLLPVHRHQVRLVLRIASPALKREPSLLRPADV